MRIGYEAKRAFLNMTGLGNYCREVIRMMAANYPHNQYFLYTPKVKATSKRDFLAPYPEVKTITPPSKLFTSLWRSKGVVKNLKRDSIDLYHGLSHELPIGIQQTGIKTVVTIHDLIFMRFPQYFGFISRKIYAAKIKYACKHADKIIAISEKTKEDLIELLNVDANKIEVIYQSCDVIFKAEQSQQKKAEVKTKYNLPEKYLLNVGTIEPRKNLLLLIKALVYLPNDTQLVVIGKETSYANKINEYIINHKLDNKVLFLKNVAFDDLPAIYQLAELFVYPSKYEGFGIPVLEALVSGTPVIAAKGSCLEEAGGPDTIYIDPDDETDLIEKIKAVLTDKPLQQKMIERGFIYAAKFEDLKLAPQLMHLYTNLLYHA